METYISWDILTKKHGLIHCIYNQAPDSWMQHGISVCVCVCVYVCISYVDTGNMGIPTYTWRHKPTHKVCTQTHTLINTHTQTPADGTFIYAQLHANTLTQHTHKHAVQSVWRLAGTIRTAISRGCLHSQSQLPVSSFHYHTHVIHTWQVLRESTLGEQVCIHMFLWVLKCKSANRFVE